MADPKAQPAPIAVTTPSGKTGYLPPEFARDAADAGVRGATDAEIRGEQLKANAAAHEEAVRKKFENGSVASGIEGEFAPSALGLLRGMSVGMSDEAILSAAEMLGGRSGREAVRQRLNAYQEYAPVRSAMGEFGGILAGSMAGDELVLGNAPGAIGRVGAAAEKGIAGLVGESSAGARIAGRALGSAAAGATEGAIYGAGKAASDAALRDDPLTGEKLVAGATHGALFGGVTGGALGALGGAGRELVSGLRAPTGEAGAVRGSITDQIEKTADVKTIKSLGGSAGDLKALENNVPGGYRRVAQDIREDVQSTTGKSIGLHSRESLHEYATKRVDELGDKLGNMLTKLDDAKTGIAPDPAAFAQRVRQELIQPRLITKADGTAVVMPGQEAPVAAVEGWLSKIENAFGDRPPTFGEWQKMRVGLDKELKFESAKVSTSVEALRGLRGAMEGELVGAGERAAKSLNDSFQAEYQQTKSLYQSVVKAQQLTERGVSRDLANNSLGLTSRIAGVVMGAAGGAAGGPLGGLVTGGASALAGKIVQNRGDQLAADLLGRIATMAGAGRITNRVTAQLEHGVKGLLPAATDSVLAPTKTLAPPVRAAAAPLGITLSGSQRKDYEKLSNVITGAQANPAAVADRVGQSLGPLGDVAPKATAAAITTTLAGLNFLAGKLPPTRADQFSLQPQFETKSRASDAEISQFMRYAQAIDDPLIVLREAKAGTLSRAHVEAVKAVYPGLYDEIRANVMRSLVVSKKELGYQQRIQLGILLDIPTDKTLSPDFLRAIQATYTSQPAGAESPPQHVAPPDVAGSVQTATQQAVERAG